MPMVPVPEQPGMFRGFEMRPTPPATSFAEHLTWYDPYVPVAFALIGAVAVGALLMIVWEKRASIGNLIITALAFGIRTRRTLAAKRVSFWQKVLHRAENP